MTTTVPAEIIRPGYPIQKVHVICPRTGRPLHRVSYPGTVEQARAYAALKVTHPSDPNYAALIAQLRG
ncbi:hypothetical protein ACLQ2R_03080 [Streptosporangium sp. DT93]|uniref:hypothetical protein n=1 Tax=Streptosporangium sp. DT93 TaxID=3393428 RepID=UPI003CE7623F